MDAKIEQFILSLGGTKANLALQLRAVMLASHPGITEAIKWRNLTFMYGKHNFAFIYSYKQVSYVNLGFFDAMSLEDPRGLFEGSGSRMRHIKVETEKDIPIVQLKKWVTETIALLDNTPVTKKAKK
jgi:hypothetical protein